MSALFPQGDTPVVERKLPRHQVAASRFISSQWQFSESGENRQDKHEPSLAGRDRTHYIVPFTSIGAGT
jgi:hypothetical protein